MTNALWIEETHLNADGGYLLGEPFAIQDDRGQYPTGREGQEMTSIEEIRAKRKAR